MEDALTARRPRSIDWSKVLLTDDFRSAAAPGPQPWESAADGIDGPRADMTCASILGFLHELPPSMQEGLFRSLLVGDLKPNVSRLAKEAGVSRPTWYANLKRASMRTWGSESPPWGRLGEARVRRGTGGPAPEGAIVGPSPPGASQAPRTGRTGPRRAERAGGGADEGATPRSGPNRLDGLLGSDGEVRPPDCLTETGFQRAADAAGTAEETGTT